MSTTAVVSVVRDGKTLVKAVAGCDGYNARRLAEAIKAERATEASVIHRLARKVGYGCKGCRVTQGQNHSLFDGTEEELGPLYHDPKVFAQPEFNPRWERGTAEHVIVIDVAELG